MSIAVTKLTAATEETREASAVPALHALCIDDALVGAVKGALNIQVSVAPSDVQKRFESLVHAHRADFE